MAGTDIVTDINDKYIPIYTNCSCCCKHFHRKNPVGVNTCDAFPDGIPEVILLEQNDHKQPYPGDHGIQFEERK
jgi:hypothetical protein